MRHIRKRFRVPRERRDPRRDRATKTIDGIRRYRQSKIGLAVRREELMAQYQRQSGVCHLCPNHMSLAEAVFLYTSWRVGDDVPVVHASCRRAYRRGEKSE